ncbi:type I phosphoribosyltransferase [Anaerobium acetethylicum]|uniref:Orotate phosphoribosyltransferase n=1 Tax=Anaerobium acetethylicum TaxID=1619234 RepID=A0A1D3TQ37_9FIRM|nr:hypothetical protein [Anaerobium acetethylicum]SCP95672.1 orotate phosphoribosyltransferase [Anaerobium acetethylicum]
MEDRAIKIYAPTNNKIVLKIIPGHFATNYSHVNYYIDMTAIKTRQSDALEAAKAMASKYANDRVVDTIVCMDGCEVIGAFFAQELANAGVLSLNAHKTIYVIAPEYNSVGQMVFRQNNIPAVAGKHVVVLAAAITAGNTVRRSLESISYYGGNIQGVETVFSAVDEIEGYLVSSIFKAKDLPEYKTYSTKECPFCKQGHKLEAVISSNGYTLL